MKRFSIQFIIMSILTTLVFWGSPLQAEMTAYEVMQKVDDRDTGKTSIAESTMILIDKKGRKRIRKTKNYAKEFGEDTKSISFFLTPADIKNTTFLSYGWDDSERDDESWLYLPALRKVKRIASSRKSGAFMGSDFTFADIEGVDIEDYNYKFLKKSEMVDGHDTWVIESKPKKAIKKKIVKETGNIQSHLWVRKDNFMMVKGRFWVKKGKKIKYLTLGDIEQIDGIWTAKKLQMVTTKKGKTQHSTILVTNSIKYNVPLEDSMFTTQRMERGL